MTMNGKHKRDIKRKITRQLYDPTKPIKFKSVKDLMKFIVKK